jgi:DNA mismatch repair ATPase MutS
MKALLMYPDQDFATGKLLQDVRYGPPDRNWRDGLTAETRALVQDLDLEAVLRAMASEDEFLFCVARHALLSGFENSLETIHHRQAALKDALRNPALIREMYDLTVQIIEMKRRRWWDLSSGNASSMLYSALDFLKAAVIGFRQFRDIGEKRSRGFASRAFTALLLQFRNEFDERYLAEVEQHLADLELRKGTYLGAELGPSNEGTNYILLRRHGKERGWFLRLFGDEDGAYTFRLGERDEAGARVLSHIRQRGIRRASLALAQSAHHVLTFFRILRTELGFYVCCLNLHTRLTGKGEPICFPVPFPLTERKLDYVGLYDVSLSLHLPGKTVGNQANAMGKNLVVITGANQGGKSSFLRAIGLAQLMMQAGMFVGAEYFQAEVCSALFTHYKREEDTTMKSGKFDEEISRINEIVKQLKPHSMVLFNESFAATNEREGSEIARQIVAALVEKEMKVFYVTHLYSFSRMFFERRGADVLFLRAERRADGTRTYKLLEEPPLETSYGQDLYRTVFDSTEQVEY